MGVVKKVCCVGAGYVGGPTCVILAKNNPNVQVHVVDINAKRIAAWNTDKLPIYEPQLLENVQVRGSVAMPPPRVPCVVGGGWAGTPVTVIAGIFSRKGICHPIVAYGCTLWRQRSRLTKRC